MLTKPNITLLALILMLSSCQTTTEQITNVDDYDKFLVLEENEALQDVKAELTFWDRKLQEFPNDFPYLAKVASAQSQLFQLTGKINYLIDAGANLKQANERTDYKMAGYLRALARNYISQHKFKEALELLAKAEINGQNRKATQKMLFDVHLELGNDSLALNYLAEIKNFTDFDYLIRLAKWKDHIGDLNAAIRYLKSGVERAESTKNEGLMHWAYTNLADFYGHSGRIQDAYNFYLKALALRPNDAYSKKGIAWIVYSHERNPKEALRILNAVTKKYNTPSYYLLKAEIAEYMKDPQARDENMEHYFSAIENKKYGDMYNKYNVLLFAEGTNQADSALRIAIREINNRPTPQSYDLLAWSHYKKGNLKMALDIIENHVAEQTFEPEALFHAAQIFKANGKVEEAMILKKALLESAFELGPLAEQRIRQI